MTQYKPGDLVTVRLNQVDADTLNNGGYVATKMDRDRVLSHQPAPEPSVFYVNVYDDRCVPRIHYDEIEANKSADTGRVALFKITHTDGSQPSIEKVL